MFQFPRLSVNPQIPTFNRMLVKREKSDILTVTLPLVALSFAVCQIWIPYPITNYRKLVKRKKLSLLSLGANFQINADVRICDRANISSHIWLKQRTKKLISQFYRAAIVLNSDTK
ncbi:MAG: hypothetical protein ICV78_01700 [Tolypothrix sp. Co-bin9]|nr:hypothetical protein [Tolypothrix sp. Co-bin9]